MAQELDQLMNLINENENVVDQDFAGEAGASNAPVEISREEMDAMMQSISKEEQDTLFNNTNNTEVIGLCARAPHAAKYVVEEMNRTSLECDTKGDYYGETLPIKLPQKPSYPWDGYALKLPNGQVTYVAKRKMLEWLLTNTLGKVVGGDEGKSIYVAENKSQSLNAQKQPLTVKRAGLAAYTPEHIIETYELDTEQDGTTKTVTRTISLEATGTEEDGSKVKLSGKVKDFPVFRRKPEFVAALGEIGGRGSKVSKIADGGLDREEAFNKYLRMVRIGKDADLID